MGGRLSNGQPQKFLSIQALGITHLEQYFKTGAIFSHGSTMLKSWEYLGYLRRSYNYKNQGDVLYLLFVCTLFEKGKVSMTR